MLFQVRPRCTEYVQAMSSSYIYASLSLVGLCALAGAGVGVGSGVAMMYSQVSMVLLLPSDCKAFVCTALFEVFCEVYFEAFVLVSAWYI